MTRSSLFAAPARAIDAATAAVFCVLAMTAIHHVYGAWLFATPWRLHIVYISLPVGLAILGAVRLGRASPYSLTGRLASWVYVALGAIFAIGLIGLYEGGYNHVLPNLQYALGIRHTLREGLYVPPDDLIFQGTGMAQFAIALLAAWYLGKLLFSSRRSPDEAAREIPGAGHRESGLTSQG